MATEEKIEAFMKVQWLRNTSIGLEIRRQSLSLSNEVLNIK